MSEWQRLNQEVTAAIRRSDLVRADELLVETWAEARRRGTRELEANTHFTEGMLRDAQDRLEEAATAFDAALVIDRELYGPHHAAIADVLHSIAIVHRRRGNHEASLAAFREEVEVHRAAQPFAVAGALNSVGFELIALERFDEAIEAYEQAIEASGDDDSTPGHELNRAHLGAGEAYRRSRRYPQAFSQFALATQTEGASLAHELGDAVARAWFSVGIVSRYGLRGCEAQAAIAFWYASQIGAPDVLARAREELARLEERELATGDPKAWRVSYKDAAGHTHVASLTWGLFHTRVEVTAELGEIVDVELDALGVVAVATRS